MSQETPSRVRTCHFHVLNGEQRISYILGIRTPNQSPLSDQMRNKYHQEQVPQKGNNQASPKADLYDK